jgi:small subunit ribosomal protein S17
MAKGLAAADLRTSTEEELELKLTEAKIELFNLRFQAATGQLESHGRLRAVRKEIARIYTVKRERELGIVVVEEESGDECLVVSDKMDKTVVVQVEDRVKHPKYGKVIRRTKKYKAHDGENACGVGDRVLLMETRPLSATKRWRVAEILEKAK